MYCSSQWIHWILKVCFPCSIFTFMNLLPFSALQIITQWKRSRLPLDRFPTLKTSPGWSVGGWGNTWRSVGEPSQSYLAELIQFISRNEPNWFLSVRAVAANTSVSNWNLAKFSTFPPVWSCEGPQVAAASRICWLVSKSTEVWKDWYSYLLRDWFIETRAELFSCLWVQLL